VDDGTTVLELENSQPVTVWREPVFGTRAKMLRAMAGLDRTSVSS
jgi:hypothetical protein